MNIKNLAIYSVILIVITAATTKYYWPTISESIKIEEKEVIKKDIVTIIKEKKNADGSSETETQIVDHTKEASSKKYESIKIQKKDWFIAGGATINPNDVKPVYNLQVNRRIIGPFYLGASINTRKDIGVQIGAEF